MLPHDLSGGRSRLRLGGKRELVCSPLKKSEPVGQTRHEGKRKPPARHSRSEIAQNDPGNQPGMRERATETAGAAGRARGRKMMRQRNVAGTRSSSALAFLPSFNPLSSPAPTAFRSPRISQVPLTNVRSERSHALYIRRPQQTSYSDGRWKRDGS